MTLRPGRLPSPLKPKSSGGGVQTGTPITFQAPNGGLVTNADLLQPAVGSASVLLNFWPTLKGARIRGGSVRRALLEGLGDVVAVFNYKFGGIDKLFMATVAGVYDVSSPVAPPELTPASLGGQTSGLWTTVQHTSQGASMLVCVNGSDPRQLYNGTAWVTTPAITFPAGDGTATNQFNYVWLFKNREFFLKNASMDAYYLPLNSFGGEAKPFPLGGVMKKGGSLLTGFSWSIESGDGLNDMCVFISTEGEVAVYQGDDPSSIDSFALKGVYQIGKPLGKNAWIRAGADVLICTTDGLIPMSQVFQRDRQALSLVSVSREIEDDWRIAANATATGWTITQWPERNLVFITFPANSVVQDTSFVLNILTGKWSITTNWNANCFGVTQGSLFFGSTEGTVWQGDITGTDDGAPFAAVYLSQFLNGGNLGQRKTTSLARMLVQGKTRPKAMLFARADMNKDFPINQNVSIGDAQSAEWDIGLWDQAKWDNVSERQDFWFRQNVRASGDTIALGCVITSGGDFALDAELSVGVIQVEVGDQSA
ncbi:hypothetical protein [Brucella intermedia]|uniref:hypothetical protein n=1 Tax=Brucella intermedia TaxID=94625 RepID=UPI00235F2F3E|nr:hypothetical protein [Brucella intermedia]